MLKEIRPAIVLLIALTLITGLVYPLAMTGIAEVDLSLSGQGSLIEKDGKVIGSELIGQEFTSDSYFHGRPSATLGPDPADPSKTVSVPYNAANSMGSNLGPTNKALIDRVKADVDTLKAENPSRQVPIDLVTTSGSGLDPRHLAGGGLFQVPRVAKARNMPENSVQALVAKHIEGRTLGIFGEPRVNVLELNLALDKRRHLSDRRRAETPRKDRDCMADQRREHDSALRPMPCSQGAARRRARRPAEDLSRRGARRRQDL